MLQVNKTISVTGCGGLQVSEILKIPHFLENRLTDGGEVVSLTYRLRTTPQKQTWKGDLFRNQ
jgi:hypothetical protein